MSILLLRFTHKDMYLYLKSHDPVLKIRVISTSKFEFSKSWEFTYKAMAYYAAENGIMALTVYGH
jgi:hypothetical protein